MHEVAHAVIAGDRNIKVAPSFLIPNAQLGTFGSVTQASEAGRAGLVRDGAGAGGAGRGGSGVWVWAVAARSRSLQACRLLL